MPVLNRMIKSIKNRFLSQTVGLWMILINSILMTDSSGRCEHPLHSCIPCTLYTFCTLQTSHTPVPLTLTETLTPSAPITPPFTPHTSCTPQSFCTPASPSTLTYVASHPCTPQTPSIPCTPHIFCTPCIHHTPAPLTSFILICILKDDWMHLVTLSHLSDPCKIGLS